MALATQRLPQELVDHVIDLVPGQADLASCTLVCKAWAARASRQLLRRTSTLALQLPDFLRAAQGSERFRACTEELAVLGAVDIATHWDTMFSALPRLNTLTLWSNLLPRAEFTSSPPPVPRFRLAKLRIQCADLYSLPELLRPFTHVDTLELRSLVDRDDEPMEGREQGDDPAKVFGRAPLPVARLILDDSCQVGVLNSLGALTRPTALFVNGFERKDTAQLCAFLKHAGLELEHINLLPTQDENTPGYMTSIRNWNSQSLIDFSDLAGCPKLASITLDLVDVFWAICLLRAVLKHLPAGLVRLRLTITDEQCEEAVELLAAHLNSNTEKYKNLQSLELRGVCERAESDEEAEELLAELRAEIQTRFPPRYSAVTKALP